MPKAFNAVQNLTCWPLGHGLVARARHYHNFGTLGFFPGAPKSESRQFEPLQGTPV